MPSVINGFYSAANCFPLPIPLVQFICKFFITRLPSSEQTEAKKIPAWETEAMIGDKERIFGGKIFNICY